MPGFVINGIGSSTPETFSPFYSYTWVIQQLFGTSDLKIMAKDATLPKFQVKSEDVMGLSLMYHFASEVTWDPVRVTFYDTMGLTELLKTWRSKVWSIDKGLGYANDYKQPSVIKQLTGDLGNGVPWKLQNSWPSLINYGDLTYTTSDAKITDVTITYDWAEEGDGSNGQNQQANQVVGAGGGFIGRGVGGGPI